MIFKWIVCMTTFHWFCNVCWKFLVLEFDATDVSRSQAKTDYCSYNLEISDSYFNTLVLGCSTKLGQRGFVLLSREG